MRLHDLMEETFKMFPPLRQNQLISKYVRILPGLNIPDELIKFYSSNLSLNPTFPLATSNPDSRFAEEVNSSYTSYLFNGSEETTPYNLESELSISSYVGEIQTGLVINSPSAAQNFHLKFLAISEGGANDKAMSVGSDNFGKLTVKGVTFSVFKHFHPHATESDLRNITIPQLNYIHYNGFFRYASKCSLRLSFMVSDYLWGIGSSRYPVGFHQLPWNTIELKYQDRIAINLLLIKLVHYLYIACFMVSSNAGKININIPGWTSKNFMAQNYFKTGHLPVFVSGKQAQAYFITKFNFDYIKYVQSIFNGMKSLIPLQRQPVLPLK